MKFTKKNQEEAIAAFEAGLLPKDLVRGGIPSASAYKWHKNWKAAQGPAAEAVQDVDAPPPIKSPTDPTPTSKRGKTVTEDTAGLILQVGFGIWARLAKNDIAYLTPAETAQLQHPFAQTLHAIPSPIADAINTYAPPVTFVVQLMEVIQKKQEQMEAARSKQFDPLAAQRRMAEQSKNGASETRANSPADFALEPEFESPGNAGSGTRSGNGQSSGVAEPEPEFRFG